jgi:hypothetical protein
MKRVRLMVLAVVVIMLAVGGYVYWRMNDMSSIHSVYLPLATAAPAQSTALNGQTIMEAVKAKKVGVMVQHGKIRCWAPSGIADIIVKLVHDDGNMVNEVIKSGGKPLDVVFDRAKNTKEVKIALMNEEETVFVTVALP